MFSKYTEPSSRIAGARDNSRKSLRSAPSRWKKRWQECVHLFKRQRKTAGDAIVENPVLTKQKFSKNGGPSRGEDTNPDTEPSGNFGPEQTIHSWDLDPSRSPPVRDGHHNVVTDEFEGLSDIQQSGPFRQTEPDLVEEPVGSLSEVRSGADVAARTMIGAEDQGHQPDSSHNVESTDSFDDTGPSASLPSRTSVEALVRSVSMHRIRETLLEQPSAITTRLRGVKPIDQLDHGKSRQEPFIRRLFFIPEGETDKAKWPSRCALIDTGSQVSLTYEHVLEELGWNFFMQEGEPLRPIGEEPVPTVGMKHVYFCFENEVNTDPPKPWEHLFLVLKKPQNTVQLFDFLLGADWLWKAKGLLEVPADDLPTTLALQILRSVHR